MNQNRTVSWFDVVIGLLYTAGFIGAVIALRVAFGIDIDKLLPSDTAIIEAIVLGTLVVLLGSLYLQTIYYWMDKLIKWVGDRGVEKASVHGLPVNTNNMGFKYSFYNKEISNTSRMIEDEGLHEQFEETVWFVNMENRQRAYKYKLIKQQKKLTKQLRRQKRRNQEEKLKKTLVNFDIVKDQLKLANEMNVNIKKWDPEKTKALDDVLIEKIDINVKDLEAYDLMHIDNRNPNGFWERLIYSKFVIYLNKRIIPLIMPVILIMMTVYYAIIWKDTWTDYERNAFILLMTIFSYMLPLRIFSFFKTYFPVQELRPVLTAGEVFAKFRSRYHEQSQLFKQQLAKEDKEFQDRIASLVDPYYNDKDKEEDKP